ncbi:cortical actin cytoskeleton protein vip1 [Apiospora aurea]|uniref:Cortical actin cytoskeleton protein vip1 n=1 Tax=Apiospora aurea TaxID=335848 RepID=A0ABR1QHB8_9PEZI
MERASHASLSTHGSHVAAENNPSPSGSVSVNESAIICVRPRGDVYDVLSLQEETSNDNAVSFHLSHESVTDVPESLLEKFLVKEAPEHLRAADNRKVHLVVSIRSGTGLALDFYKSVLQPLLADFGLKPAPVPGEEDDAESLHLNLVVTRDAQSIREFTASLPLGVEHTVVLMSGDGGIVESLNGKATADDDDDESAPSRVQPLPLVAMLPLGTGNALFNSLHKGVYAASEAESTPSPLVLGLRTLLRGRRAPLPSFRVDFSAGSRQVSYKDADEGGLPGAVREQLSPVSHLYGAIVASYGFHAQLVWESDTPEYRKHGAKRFGMVAAELLKESHAYHARVGRSVLPTSSDKGQEQQQQEPQPIDRPRHAYVLATLVSNLERTFTISPASRPLEGRLRLVHFGPVGGERTMEIMTQAYNDGRHVGMTWATTTPENGEEKEEEEGVGYEQVGEVRVVTHEQDARWRKVCVDGTIVELPLQGSMTVRTESAPHLDILVDPSVIAAAATAITS